MVGRGGVSRVWGRRGGPPHRQDGKSTQYLTFLIYVSSMYPQTSNLQHSHAHPGRPGRPPCTPPAPNSMLRNAAMLEGKAAYIALSVAISSAVSANEESARSSAMYTGSSPGLVVI